MLLLVVFPLRRAGTRKGPLLAQGSCMALWFWLKMGLRFALLLKPPPLSAGTG